MTSIRKAISGAATLKDVKYIDIHVNQVTFAEWIPCYRCKGRGIYNWFGWWNICPVCKGVGYGPS